MNKAVQYLFIILFPFYPIWAWVSYAFLKKPVTFFVCLVLLPLALYYIVTAFKKLPAYLLCFLGFTTYHLVSVFVNDLVPKESSVLYFLLTIGFTLAASAHERIWASRASATARSPASRASCRRP